MWITIVLAVLATAQAPARADASKLTLSAPTAILELDTGKLKGDLSRLSWSPDASQIYIQTIERERSGDIKATRHYLLGLDSKATTTIDAEPPWAKNYWTWKSAQSAPGLVAFRIEPEQTQKRRTATATPMGGDLAKGSPEGGTGVGGAATGLGAGDAMSAAIQSQMVNVYTLRLKGEVVGEFVNAPAIPGLTFGWAPVGTGLIAFANQTGRIVVMDDQGRKQEIAGSKAALLPAWSGDGARLAYLERTGRNKASLKIVEAGRP
jgi:hypothetical protein